MRWIGEEGGGRGQSRRGQNADSNRQKQKRGEKREGRGEFFSNLFISAPPSDGELRVGAGLGAEEEKTLTTRQRCLEDLPPAIVSSKVGVYKVKKSVVLQVWPKLYLCEG